MSNSILNQNLGGDNPMNSLSFYWLATFKDNSIINQFDDNGTEHKFQEVKDKFDELKYFILYNRNNREERFIVDLENGYIFTDKAIKYDEDNEIKKNNIRLIFTRRHRSKMNENFQEINHEIVYILGYQYLDEFDKNHKIVLRIDQHGNFSIGE
jgi:hypothetical protein